MINGHMKSFTTAVAALLLSAMAFNGCGGGGGGTTTTTPPSPLLGAPVIFADVRSAPAGGGGVLTVNFFDIGIDTGNTTTRALGLPLMYSIDYGDGSPIETFAPGDNDVLPSPPGLSFLLDSFIASHDYAPGGPYTVTITKTDANGDVLVAVKDGYISVGPPTTVGATAIDLDTDAAIVSYSLNMAGTQLTVDYTPPGAVPSELADGNVLLSSTPPGFLVEIDAGPHFSPDADTVILNVTRVPLEAYFAELELRSSTAEPLNLFNFSSGAIPIVPNPSGIVSGTVSVAGTIEFYPSIDMDMVISGSTVTEFDLVAEGYLSVDLTITNNFDTDGNDSIIDDEQILLHSFSTPAQIVQGVPVIYDIEFWTAMDALMTEGSVQLQTNYTSQSTVTVNSTLVGTDSMGTLVPPTHVVSFDPMPVIGDFVGDGDLDSEGSIEILITPRVVDVSGPSVFVRPGTITELVVGPDGAGMRAAGLQYTLYIAAFLTGGSVYDYLDAPLFLPDVTAPPGNEVPINDIEEIHDSGGLTVLP